MAETEDIAESEAYPDEWWFKVYVGVVINAVLVISLLWAFSR